MDTQEMVKLLTEMGFYAPSGANKSNTGKCKVVKDKNIDGTGTYFIFDSIPKRKSTNKESFYVAFAEGPKETTLSKSTIRPTGGMQHLPNTHNYLFRVASQKATKGRMTHIYTYWRESAKSEPMVFATSFLGKTAQEESELDAAYCTKKYAGVAAYTTGLVDNRKKTYADLRELTVDKKYYANSYYTNSSANNTDKAKTGIDFLYKVAEALGCRYAIGKTIRSEESKQKVSGGPGIYRPVEFGIDGKRAVTDSVFIDCTKKGESKMAYIEQHEAIRKMVTKTEKHSSGREYTHATEDLKAHRKVLVPETHRLMIENVLKSGLSDLSTNKIVITTKASTKTAYATCLLPPDQMGNRFFHYKFTFVIDFNDSKAFKPKAKLLNYIGWLAGSSSFREEESKKQNTQAMIEDINKDLIAYSEPV